MQRRRVVLDHDGGVDDLAALVVLACDARINLAGVVVVDADCFVEPAVECSLKTAALCRLGHPVTSHSNRDGGNAEVSVDPTPSTNGETRTNGDSRFAARWNDQEAAAATKAWRDSPAIQVGASSLPCAGPEPFPDEWRLDSTMMALLPCINGPDVLDHYRRCCAAVDRSGEDGGAASPTPLSGLIRHRTDITGEELLAELVMSAPPGERTTICVTGPLSNVAYCLRKYGPAFATRIESIVVMGGAVGVRGNVFTAGRDGTAEWNIYWDPLAAAEFVSTPLLAAEQKLFFTLDATNDVPVTETFVRKFGAVLNVHRGEPLRNGATTISSCSSTIAVSTASSAPTLLAQFLGSTWATCTAYEELFGPGKGYYAWDALTAAFVVEPSVMNGVVSMRLAVVVDPLSPSCGRTIEQQKPHQQSRSSANKERGTEAEGVLPEGDATVALGTRAELFYRMMLRYAACA